MAYESNIKRFASIATDPLRSFRFQAEFTANAADPVFDPRITQFSGGFQNITGLEVNVSSLTYREGGFNTTLHRVPGMTSFSDITMSRGAIYGNAQALTWMRGLFAVTSGEGINLGSTGGPNSKNFRCNIKIYVMDHPNADSETNTPRMGFIVRNAWPRSINYGSLNAEASGLLVEQITFVHEGLSVFYTDSEYKPSDPSYILSGV